MIVEEHRLCSRDQDGEFVIKLKKDSLVVSVGCDEESILVCVRTVGLGDISDRMFYVTCADSKIPNDYNIYYGTVYSSGHIRHVFGHLRQQ